MQTSSEIQFPIRRSWIMLVMLIVPAVAIFGVWDFFLNQKQLLPYLRIDSLFLPLYLLIFELPHIIASFFGFFQKEYLSHYKQHILFFLPLILVCFLILVYFNFFLAVVVYLIATLFHVVRQQTGIALFYRVPKNIWHAIWSWSLIVGMSSLYIFMVPSLVSETYNTWLLMLGQTALVLSLLVSLRLVLQTKNLLGVVYVLATSAMVIVSYGMLVLGYVFLAVLVVRVIHDVTAFIFYVTHEMNSNHELVKNWLYLYIPFLPWSLVVVIPLVAILLGLLVRSVIYDPRLLFVVVMVLAFAHYYLESIIWKRDGLHRKQIKIV